MNLTKWMFGLFLLYFCIGAVAGSPNIKISGVLQVSDTIENIGSVDSTSFMNSTYSDKTVLIWKIVPEFETGSGIFNSLHPAYLKNVIYHAKLEDNQLSILVSGDRSQTLRTILPAFGEKDQVSNEFYEYSNPSDLDHWYMQYNEEKTVLYYLLTKAFQDLKKQKVISANSELQKNPHYQSDFTNSIYVFGYSLAANEYSIGPSSFHNWPWGEGKDPARYYPTFFTDEYSRGVVASTFDFIITNPRNYFSLARIGNDNLEESQFFINDIRILHQYGVGAKWDTRWGNDKFPDKIVILAKKTWSLAHDYSWIALDADSVTVTGQIKGEGQTSTNYVEYPDVLHQYNLQKRSSLTWDYPLMVSPTQSISQTQTTTVPTLSILPTQSVSQTQTTTVPTLSILPTQSVSQTQIIPNPACVEPLFDLTILPNSIQHGETFNIVGNVPVTNDKYRIDIFNVKLKSEEPFDTIYIRHEILGKFEFESIKSTEYIPSLYLFTLRRNENVICRQSLIINPPKTPEILTDIIAKFGPIIIVIGGIFGVFLNYFIQRHSQKKNEKIHESNKNKDTGKKEK